MKVRHVRPEGWVDTGEVGVIQPSDVAGLVHEVEFEPADLLPLLSALMPVGALMVVVCNGSPPAEVGGWLLCDGQEVAESDWPELFAAVGGGASGVLPNLSGGGFGYSGSDGQIVPWGKRFTYIRARV